jgi:hypothetical protein
MNRCRAIHTYWITTLSVENTLAEFQHALAFEIAVAPPPRRITPTPSCSPLSNNFAEFGTRLLDA